MLFRSSSEVSTTIRDTTPPLLSGVATSSITSSGATITWTSDEPGDSQIEYGTTTAYGSKSPLNSTLVTSHSVKLSGLTRLTASKADDEHPTWSPDGSRIAFASGFPLRSQGHLPWLVSVPAGGGPPKRIGRFSGVLDPNWSPAGVR